MTAAVEPALPLEPRSLAHSHAAEANFAGRERPATWREFLFGDPLRGRWIDEILRARLRLTRVCARVTSLIGLFGTAMLIKSGVSSIALTINVTVLMATYPVFYQLNLRRRFTESRAMAVCMLTFATLISLGSMGSDRVPIHSFLLLDALLVLLAFAPSPRSLAASGVLGAAYVALDVVPLETDFEYSAEGPSTAFVLGVTVAGILGAVNQMHRLFTVMRRREDRFKRSLESSKLKERQSQARMAFLTMMSHEIRTPLNAVIGLSDLLSSALESTEHEDMARTISSSSQALLTVVNDVLDFSRVDAGHVSLVPSDTDLDDVVDATVQGLYSSAAAKGVELHADVRLPYPFRVSVDGVRLRQVLTNLTGNAIKFTDRGHVLLTVQPLADEEGVIEFSVSDTGCGIEESAVATIFEPFMQAEGGTARRFDGTGLGLAISQRIVKAMDGRMGVESTVGVGTHFWVRLSLSALALSGGEATPTSDPVALRCRSELLQATLQRALEAVGATVDPSAHMVIAEATDQPEIEALIAEGRAVVAAADPFQELGAASGVPRLALPVRRAALKAVVQRSKATTLPPIDKDKPPARLDDAHKGLRVLVADDNAVNRKVIARMLKKLGCETELAEDGQQAVERFAAADPKPDVVLMDCHMPVMDGFEATRAIRAIDASVPVVALTADAFEDARAQALQSGMRDVVTKPVLLSQLAAALTAATHPGEHAE